MRAAARTGGEPAEKSTGAGRPVYTRVLPAGREFCGTAAGVRFRGGMFIPWAECGASADTDSSGRTVLFSAPPYGAESGTETIAVPRGIGVIGENAFRNCACSAVILPDTVREIQRNAFAACTAEYIYFAPGLCTIGSHAFCCGFLKTAILPETLTRIGAFAFSFSENLRTVSAPAGCGGISDSAFAASVNLTAVSVPCPAGDQTFVQCKGLSCAAVLTGGPETLPGKTFLRSGISPDAVYFRGFPVPLSGV